MRRRSRLSSVIPVLAVLTAIPAAQAADISDVQFHGFVSQGYLWTSNNNWYGDTQDHGSFEFNEFALNAVARPVDRLRIGIQLFARDLGLYGNDEVQIDWAYADYQAVQADWGSLGVTVGRFKTTYGLYNETRDVDMARTQVFLPTTVYNNRLRDVYLALNGIQLYGNVKMHKAGSMDWTVALGSNTLNTDGAAADVFEETGVIGDVTDLSTDNTTTLSLTWNTPLEGLRFRGSVIDLRNLRSAGTAGTRITEPAIANMQAGVNGAIAAAPPAPPFGLTGNSVSLDSSALEPTTVTASAPHYYTGIVSAEYQFGDWTFAAEWMREYAKFQIESTVTPNIGYLNTTINAANPAYGGALGPGITTNSAFQPQEISEYMYQKLEGFYFTASYRFLERWEIAGGPQTAFSDYSERGAGTVHRGWSAALRYDIFSNWLVKAEWQSIRGTQQLYSSENPEGAKYTWNMLALKTTVDF